jgi:hypothetical protein
MGSVNATRKDRARSFILAAALPAFLPATPALAGLGFCSHFIRGDSNLDGTVNLSDGVRTLNHLFLGDAPLGCADAADADDSGVLELTDAVYTFLFLFSASGRAPPAPGPFDCGRDGGGPFGNPDGLTCESAGACAPVPQVHDFSGFTSFACQQGPGLGFCPDLDRVFRLAIEKGAEGYRLDLFVLVAGTPGDPACIPTIETECALETLLSSRVLTAGETAAVQSVFSAVPVFPEPSPDCDCIAVDPCTIRSFAWDGRRFGDYICSPNRIAWEDVQPLLALFEDLRPQL